VREFHAAPIVPRHAFLQAAPDVSQTLPAAIQVWLAGAGWSRHRQSPEAPVSWHQVPAPVSLRSPTDRSGLAQSPAAMCHWPAPGHSPTPPAPRRIQAWPPTAPWSRCRHAEPRCLR
tara:strand:- start:40268 stop:40618 length:351 start_codon:yes stop_codon:yes gene_type:complete